MDVFQKFLSGDLETLGSIFNDSITGKSMCKCDRFGSTVAGSTLHLQYISAVVYGIAGSVPDTDINNFGEFGYVLPNGNSFRQQVPFQQSNQTGIGVLVMSQKVSLYIPEQAKPFLIFPTFHSTGGARVSVGGVYIPN